MMFYASDVNADVCLNQGILVTKVFANVCLMVGKDTGGLHGGAGNRGLGRHSETLPIV